MENLIDIYGEARLLMVSGAVVGLLFGMSAFRSRFCLRAATAEVANGTPGPRLAIWLMVFFAALASVQTLIATGVLQVAGARQLAATGSLSGAIIGGLMFGAGMVLARGCASRLLVLSATGNLRAIVTGLVLTLVAQASLRGVLAPPREALAALWTIPGGTARDMAAWLPLSTSAIAALAMAALVASLVYGRHQKVPASELLAALAVGGAVCLGWVLTHAIAVASYEVVAVQSVTFTGPSTDTLMALVNRTDIPAGFGVGLVPGVALGALLAALIRSEARIRRFKPDVPMERYLAGGVLMGFGSMLAGGCAVGAGVSGGSILALAAWLAVFCMWLGAMVTQRVQDVPWLRQPG